MTKDEITVLIRERGEQIAQALGPDAGYIILVYSDQDGESVINSCSNIAKEGLVSLFMAAIRRWVVQDIVAAAKQEN